MIGLFLLIRTCIIRNFIETDYFHFIHFQLQNKISEISALYRIYSHILYDTSITVNVQSNVYSGH